MTFDPSCIPEEWLKNFTWDKIDKFQRNTGSDLLFLEKDFEVFKEALSFVAQVQTQMDFMLKYHSILMFPSDNAKGTKPDLLPVIGFSGCIPGTDIPEKVKKQLPKNNPPNSLRFSEKMKSKRGTIYNRWDEIEKKAENVAKYREGKPSPYMSQTSLSLHKPFYPSVAIWDFNLEPKWGRASIARGSSTPLLESRGKEIQKKFHEKIKESDRLYLNLSNAFRPRLFIFSEPPKNNLYFKESMAAGRGRLKIHSNRIWAKDLD